MTLCKNCGDRGLVREYVRQPLTMALIEEVPAEKSLPPVQDGVCPICDGIKARVRVWAATDERDGLRYADQKDFAEAIDRQFAENMANAIARDLVESGALKMRKHKPDERGVIKYDACAAVLMPLVGVHTFADQIEDAELAGMERMFNIFKEALNACRGFDNKDGLIFNATDIAREKLDAARSLSPTGKGKG